MRHVIIVVGLVLGLARIAAADVGTLKCADDKHFVFDPNAGCVKRPPAPPKSPEALYQQGLDILAKDAKRAAANFDQACKRKHAKSCTQLGFLYSSGRDRAVQQDDKRAAELFELGCTLNDASACRRRGIDLSDDDEVAARVWLDKGCALSEGTSCALLAFRQLHGIGGPEDTPGAEANFEKAHKLLDVTCKTSGDACWLIGYLAENGIGETADLVKAVDGYRRGCAQSYSEACVDLAHGLEKTGGSGTDIDSAYLAACNYDHAESCVDLSIRIADREPQSDQIMPLAERACQLDAQQCFTLARWYELGRGIGEPDQAKSTTIWKNTCDAGVYDACVRYGRRLVEGTGITADAPGGMQYWEQACDDGYAGGCEALSQYLVNDKSDDARAYTVAMKGCGVGSGYACYIVGFLTKNNRHGSPMSDEVAMKEAIQWFDKGCTTSDAIACNELADAQLSGSGTKKDVAAARTNYSAACFADSEVQSEACVTVADMARKGTGGAVDLELAAKASARGCAYGDMAQCTAVERTPKEQLEPVLAELSARCIAGDDTSCLVEADIEATLSADEKKAAYDTFEQMCGHGEYRACLRQADLLLAGTVGPADAAKATKIYTEQCAADIGLGCRAMVVYTYFTTKDYTAALSWSEKGCALGEADSCSMNGFLYVVPPAGLTWDVKKGGALYDRACDLGSAIGCANVAELYRYGIDRPIDAAKAYEVAKKGCELGSAFSCAEQAHGLASGEGITKDVPAALELYRAACADEQPAGFGCVELAGVLEAEHQGTAAEVARSRQKGFALVEKDARDNAGYKWYLGVYYRDGVGVPKDEAKGLQLFEDSCAGYWPLGCLDAAKMLVRSPDKTLAARGKSYYERACAAGVDEGCKGFAGGGDVVPGPKPVEKPKGCGCSGEVAPGSEAAFGLVLLFTLRRRRART